MKTGISVSMAYAYAALLRWLTPIRIAADDDDDTDNTIYIGWLDGFSKHDIDIDTTVQNHDSNTITYADNLRYNLQQGWYEFKCACYVTSHTNTTTSKKSIASHLAEFSTMPQQPSAYLPIVRAYMTSASGGNCETVAKYDEFNTLVAAIATIYARMIMNDGMMIILEEILNHKTVQSEVNTGNGNVVGKFYDCSDLIDWAHAL